MTVNPRQLSSNRTVRDEVRILLRLGFVYDGTHGGHHSFSHPVHGALAPMSSSPRNEHSWRRRHRTEVARLMGLNLWQFERLIAGQPLRRTGKRKRHAVKIRPTRRRTLALISEPAREPVASIDAHRGQPRWRRHRCGSCAYPWMAKSYRPADECPRCGARDVRDETNRQAA